MLRLADAWTWDFWLADDGRSYHLYFLKAPRHIGHPDERHWNVSIGHAVSPNLADWTVVPDAIAPSDGPAFDHIATWTGSVVRGRDGNWFMFYTGVGSQERALKQRIGLATSADPTQKAHGTSRPRRHRRSSLTTQHRRSPNGTDNS